MLCIVVNISRVADSKFSERGTRLGILQKEVSRRGSRWGVVADE
jgi:hypothetical protein